MISTNRKIKSLPKSESEITPAPLVFYCKNCEKIVNATQTRKKFCFRCPECKKMEVAFGTKESISNHYRIKSEA
jgi:Zn finger protein HypA/HybF involved in hydrogenase expression